MKNTIITKENGNVTYQEVEHKYAEKKAFEQELRENLVHLCTSCDNCRSSLCEKIADEAKKEIGDYPFIDEGLQVFDKDNEIDLFYVTKCNNYKKDHERVKQTSADQLRELRRLKESIKMAYFDAETIEEADETQRDLFRRGQLIKYEYDSHTK